MHLQDYRNLYTSKKGREEIYYVLLVILAQHVSKCIKKVKVLKLYDKWWWHDNS